MGSHQRQHKATLWRSLTHIWLTKVAGARSSSEKAPVRLLTGILYPHDGPGWETPTRKLWGVLPEGGTAFVRTWAFEAEQRAPWMNVSESWEFERGSV